MADVDVLIVGAGFAGSVCAERLASAGKRVLVVERRAHIGGNAFDEYNADGILVHRYGPHIFHTNSSDVFEYLSQFTAWRAYTHRVRAWVNGTLLPMPINQTTLAWFHGDEQAAREALIRPYTQKQWGCNPESLDPSVLARIQTRASDDDRYFTDVFQMMPRDGYTRLIERLLEHRNISVLLQTSFEQAEDLGLAAFAGDIIYTGPIDEFFGYEYGRLPYRSARFVHDTLDTQEFQPVGVVNYPTLSVNYTRITEFKHLTGQRHARTTICREYPCDEGEPLWPIPSRANLALAARYKARAKADGIYFCGRLGTYQYLNIDQVVAQALKLSATVLKEAA